MKNCAICQNNVISMSQGEYCKHGVPGFPNRILCNKLDVESNPDKVRDIIRRCEEAIKGYQAVIVSCNKILGEPFNTAVCGYCQRTYKISESIGHTCKGKLDEFRRKAEIAAIVKPGGTSWGEF